MMKLNLILITIAILSSCTQRFAAAPLTDVRVFESRITGGYVYCRTGELPAATHIDLGTAQVAESKVVDCPNP